MEAGAEAAVFEAMVAGHAAVEVVGATIRTGAAADTVAAGAGRMVAREGAASDLVSIRMVVEEGVDTGAVEAEVDSVPVGVVEEVAEGAMTLAVEVVGADTEGAVVAMTVAAVSGLAVLPWDAVDSKAGVL